MRFIPFACSVCYGDPSSLLSKGASAGVLFMIGTVAFVLTTFVFFTLRIVYRSRKLNQEP